jgi:hypothetical protein
VSDGVSDWLRAMAWFVSSLFVSHNTSVFAAARYLLSRNSVLDAAAVGLTATVARYKRGK